MSICSAKKTSIILHESNHMNISSNVSFQANHKERKKIRKN